MKNNPEQNAAPDFSYFTTISQNDLKTLGIGDVAYVRRHTVNGKNAFVLYAADGTVLLAQSNEANIHSAAQNQGLGLVIVH